MTIHSVCPTKHDSVVNMKHSDIAGVIQVFMSRPLYLNVRKAIALHLASETVRKILSEL